MANIRITFLRRSCNKNYSQILYLLNSLPYTSNSSTKEVVDKKKAGNMSTIFIRQNRIDRFVRVTVEADLPFRASLSALHLDIKKKTPC